MVSLDRFDTFKAVVEAGSLTGAAKALGQTRAVVSFNIIRLEAELGVSLLTRSTRKVVPTEAGERFYRRCVRVLDEARLAIDDARSEHKELTGTLRITTTFEYGLRKIVPALEAFTRLHPGLRVCLSSSSGHADLISERFDLAIRIGSMEDTSHRATLLSRHDIFPVASAAFLQRLPHGGLATLEALAQAPWIEHSRLPASRRWDITGPDGKTYPWRPRGKAMLAADSASALHAFALAGHGVALLPAWMIEADLQLGRLCRLLPDYRFPVQGVYAVYPNTRHVPAKVKSFIGFLKNSEAAAGGTAGAYAR
ncbi:LysR family transcriptional regulator [Cupriavidus basilensis]|uniref:LysR family transcriptional regulator n=1 Tax=Cupriavidus basilensis TaxID=68895 RepID=A0ABT6ATS3_9BURK|nr:LysR family transcriptional regulator [Cupriavidus basilensis]MDF3836029.1 LysR family transcriptional regulator [Cupriavidus basilensis]